MSNHFFLKQDSKRYLKSFFFKTALLILITISFSYGYLVKVDKSTISSKEFQKYIDVQKFTTGESSFKVLLKNSGNMSRKQYLRKVYLKNWFLLREAKKKGLSVQDKEIEEINNKTYKQNLQKLFLLREYMERNLLNKSKISDSEIEEIYERIRTQRPEYPKYSNLDTAKKRQIQSNPMFQQLLLAARTEKASKKYLKSMKSKRYKVKEYSLSKKVIAKVNNEKITKRDYDLILSQNGIRPEQMDSLPKDRRKEMEKSVMNQLILTKIVDLEIIRTKFDSKKSVKSYFKYQKELFLVQRFQQLLTQEFIKEGRIKITDAELDAAYEQLRRQNPGIANQPLSKIQELLRNRIAANKAAPLLNSYLEDIIFEAQIKIDSKELDKIS